MQERPSDLASSTRFPKKLIMVLEQDCSIGTRFVQMIRQETPYQAILATSPQQVRRILHHLTCDVFLLTDDTFPAEDLENLSVLQEDIKRTRLLSLTFLSWTYNYRDGTDVKTLVKAVHLLLSIRNSPPGVLGVSGAANGIET